MPNYTFMQNHQLKPSSKTMKTCISATTANCLEARTFFGQLKIIFQ